MFTCVTRLDDMKDTSPYFSRQTGEIHISIEFSTSVHNFKGYKTVDEFCIYDCEKYSIMSYARPMKEGFYTAPDLYIFHKGAEEEELLEDYAFSWINDPTRDISIFNSKDFLEQTCITHCIWRIQDSNNSLEPFNDYQKEVKQRTDKIIDSMLTIFKPKLIEVVKKFHSKYQHLDFNNIQAEALRVVSNMIIGENKKHIEKTLNILNKEPDQKQKARVEFRSDSIHTIKSRKDKKSYGPDLETIKNGAIAEILRTTNPDSLYSVELLVRLLQPDNFSTFVSESLSYNSPKVYSVFNEESLANFIFGSKGKFIPLFGYLRDVFKNKIKQYKNNIYSEHVDDFDQFTIDDSYDFVGKGRKWKANINSYSESQIDNFTQEAQQVLKGKKLEAYVNWLNNAYVSSNQAERQNLHKAKVLIKESKIDIPVPISQKG